MRTKRRACAGPNGRRAATVVTSQVQALKQGPPCPQFSARALNTAPADEIESLAA